MINILDNYWFINLIKLESDIKFMENLKTIKTFFY